MLDNYRDLIDELLGTPSILRDLAATAGGLPPAVVPMVADLRDRDMAVLDRVQRMTRETTPLLPAAADGRDAADDPATLLADFDRARGDIVSLLMNLTLKDWERTGIDASGEEVVVADEVERHVEFDEVQVDRIRKAFGG